MDKLVFLSYSRRDMDQVRMLIQDFEEVGYPVWFDQALTGGQRWWDGILSKLRECAIFVLALTPDSLKSDACWREFTYARDLHKPILPIRLSDKLNITHVRHPLNEYQVLDYLRQDKQAAFALFKTLISLPEAGPLPDPLPAPPPIPVSYLDTLREQVEATRNLTFEEQTALVFKLKKRLTESDAPEESAEVRDLILLLRRRDDLLAKIADEIAPLLEGLKDVRSVQPESVETVPKSPPKHPQHLFSKIQRARKEAPREPESVIDETVSVLHRVLDQKENWVLTADRQNYIALNAQASRWLYLQAKANFRSDSKGEKKRLLKSLEWKVSGGWIRRYLTAMVIPWGIAAAASAALLEESRRWVSGYTDRYGDYVSGYYVTDSDYLAAIAAIAAMTIGLSLLSPLNPRLRDFLMRKRATRRWTVTDPAHTLPEIAEELILLLHKLVPACNRITIEKH